MHAFFAAQIAIGVVALYLKRDGFDARFIAFQDINQCGFKAHVLAVAGVHAVEHPRPVLGFRAARACVQGQDGVVLVIVPAHQRLQRQGVHLLLQVTGVGIHFSHDARVLFLQRHMKHQGKILPGVFQGFILLNFVFQPGDALVDHRGALQVVPEAG